MTIKVNYIDLVKLRLFMVEYNNYNEVKKVFVRISHSELPSIAPMSFSIIDGQLYSQDSDDLYYWYGKARDNQIALIHHIKGGKK